MGSSRPTSSITTTPTSPPSGPPSPGAAWATPPSRPPTPQPATGGAAYSADAFTSTIPYLSEGFETGANGWTASIARTTGTTGTLAGLWERAIPVGTLAAPGAAHGGQYCFVTENGPTGGG